MPNWCLVLCICGNVDFMTTVKTHLLWLKFIKLFQIDSRVCLFLPAPWRKKNWLEFSSSATLRILIDLGNKATRSSRAKNFKWRWPSSGSSEKPKNAFVVSKPKHGFAARVFVASGGPTSLVYCLEMALRVRPQVDRLIVLCIEQLHTGSCVVRGSAICLLDLFGKVSFNMFSSMRWSVLERL